MATHYRGQRIDELLGEIATLEKKLNEMMSNEPIKDSEVINKFAGAYTPLVLAKAKLTALQGETK